jgi:hypothetical protein
MAGLSSRLGYSNSKIYSYSLFSFPCRRAQRLTPRNQEKRMSRMMKTAAVRRPLSSALGWTVFAAGTLHGLQQALALLTRGL